MKKYILPLILGTIFTNNSMGAIRYGSFYIGSEKGVISDAKELLGINNEETNKNHLNTALSSVISDPELFFDQNTKEYQDVLSQFGESNAKKSYLKHVVEQYNLDYPIKNEIKVNAKGDGNKVTFEIHSQRDLRVSNEDDLGFKKTICSYDFNSMLLSNGVEFEAKYFINGDLLDTKEVKGKPSSVCSGGYALKIKQEEILVDKTESEKPKKSEVAHVIVGEEPKIVLSPTPQEKLPSKENIIYLPQTLIMADIKEKNGSPVLEQPSDFEVIKLESEKVVTSPIVAPSVIEEKTIEINPIKVSKEEAEKLEKALISKTKKKSREADLLKSASHIKDLYKTAENDEERALFQNHIGELIKKYYDEMLKKNKNQKKSSSVSLDVDNKNINFVITFNKRFTKQAMKSIPKWEKQNEAKKFVCADIFLKSMLDIGLVYNVRYMDFEGNMLYVEDVSGDSSQCK